MRGIVGQPKTLDFYRCTRPVQDRFVAATLGTAPPAPLLFSPATRVPAWLLFGASVVVFVCGTVVLLLGWGNVSSPLALHRDLMLPVDVLFFSSAAFCFVRAAVFLRTLEALPYRAGTYVFPACIIDATGRVLRVWSTADVESSESIAAPGLALRMRDGALLVVAAQRIEDAQRAQAALESLRPELTAAIARDHIDALSELDPLHPTRVSSPISSTESLERYAPLWVRLDWALAFAIGLALGLGLGALRNASSDDRMFHAVTAAQNVAQYRQYLARGGRHSEEVRDVLLPRSELALARAHGGVEGLQDFARAHASAKIGPEIDAAVRQATLVELDKARAQATVTALDAFAQKYPDHLVDPELKAARHALYSSALMAWRAKTRVDPATGAFIERLLAAAEHVGPSCEVRFRLRASKTIDDADRRVAKHVFYPGPDALPSRYLGAQALRPREEHVAQTVVDGFAAAFPSDILAVSAGAPLAADSPTPAPPVLVVDYAPEWSAANTSSTKPKTIFAGILFDFDARFALPDGPPLLLSVKSRRAPETWKIKGGRMLLPEFEQKVYDAMVDHAFADLEKRLVETLFR